jgi:hypothetical protein
MFESLLIHLFGESLYTILLSDYPVILALFVILCFYTVILAFSYFVKGCFTGFR